MKLIQIIPITILALVLAATLASATHTPQVLLSPSEWEANTQKDLIFTVTNSNGDPITRVELDAPLNSDQSTIYTIVDAGSPSGWTALKFEKKVVWTTTGTGINVGNTLSFGLTVVSPASGQYKWNWITTDSTGDKFTGSSTTKVGSGPASYFKVTASSSVIAGNVMKATVRVYGSDNNLKTDYTGTISFTSSDAKAVLPSPYTFTSSDGGVKDFTITYKTAGGQTITVTDLTSKITQKSAITVVKPGIPIALTIMPDNEQVAPGNTVKFTAVAKDQYDNSLDVTSSTKWNIDSSAGGSWNSSTYTAGAAGTWIVIGTYNGLADGTTLTIKQGAVVTPTENVTPPVVTNETVPTTQPTESMEINAQDSVTIAPGSNETFVVTVDNTGSEDLVDVSLSATNISSDWITSYPSKITIGTGTSKDFLVVISVPANETNETESINAGLVATSNDGTMTTKAFALTISSAPTGLIGLSKNLLNLGIVIVAVAALVLIAWELWFRKK